MKFTLRVVVFSLLFFCFVSFRFVSFRFVSFLFVSFCFALLSEADLWEQPASQPALVLDVASVRFQAINPVVVARNGKGCRPVILMQQVC